MTRFEFAFTPLYRAAGVALGITPGRCWVEVDGAELRARFGFWAVGTSLANVAGTQVTGPYGVLRTVGPAHLSLSDRGLTFATNADRGLCIRFHEPVPGLDPLGRLRHPGLTVTVADLDGLAEALTPVPGPT